MITNFWVVYYMASSMDERWICFDCFITYMPMSYLRLSMILRWKVEL